jgi:hypothetical protein
MTDITPRLSLPLLTAGQAQKEITHNEALVLVDALIAARVAAVNALTPPTAPTTGQSWALGTAPTGLWAGQGGALAVATAGGWRFCAVPEGFSVRVAASGAIWLKQGTSWAAPAAIGAVSGGSVIDSEARSAIMAVRAALIGHGLITAA